MTQAVVLVEEESAPVIVREIAHRLGIAERTLVIRFEGRNDLERSIPVKLSRWRAPGPVRFLILRDSDGGDCKALKEHLRRLLHGNAVQNTRIRVVVEELEAWYFGEPQALAAAGYAAAATACRRAKFRRPDAIKSPKLAMRRPIGCEGQIALARRLAPWPHLTLNASPSYAHFVSALKWAADLPSSAP